MNIQEAQLELRSYPGEVNAHQHDHYHQLVLPCEGTLEMQVGHREGRVGPSCLAVVPAGETHAFAAQGDNRFLVADLPLMMADAWAQLPAFVPLSQPLRQYIGFLQSWLGAGHTAAVPGCDRVLAELLITPKTQTLTDSRIEHVRDWMSQHFAEPLTLLQLASLSCLSVRQFSARFRQATGQSPQQYLIQLRMQRAQALLQQTDMSLQQVSDAVGYASVSAFSHRFREQLGISPGYYRRNAH